MKEINELKELVTSKDSMIKQLRNDKEAFAEKISLLQKKIDELERTLENKRELLNQNDNPRNRTPSRNIPSRNNSGTCTSVLI